MTVDGMTFTNSLDPTNNTTGHQWWDSEQRTDRYLTCAWCKCVENTKEAATRCPEAYKAKCGSSIVEWYRRSKWLPPDGKEIKS
jgi:hypothetical protein